MTVNSQITVVLESMKSMYVGIIASVSRVSVIAAVLLEKRVAKVLTNVPQVVLENRVLTIATVRQPKLVAKVLTNVPQVVLENRVLTIATVRQPKLVAKVLANVPQVVLENRVQMIGAVLQENVVIQMANVNQVTVMKVHLVGLLLLLFSV